MSPPRVGRCRLGAGRFRRLGREVSPPGGPGPGRFGASPYGARMFRDHGILAGHPLCGARERGVRLDPRSSILGPPEHLLLAVAFVGWQAVGGGRFSQLPSRRWLPGQLRIREGCLRWIS